MDKGHAGTRFAISMLFLLSQTDGARRRVFFRREDEAHPHLLTRDVGVDACEYRPVSFEELRAYMAPRVEAFRRRKAGLAQGGEDAAV